MTPADLQVLSDLLHERMPPDQAAFVLKVASHPKKAQVLFDLPLAYTCPCGANREEYAVDEDGDHTPDCKVVAALTTFEDSRLKAIHARTARRAQAAEHERLQLIEYAKQLAQQALENRRRLEARRPIAATHSSHIPAEDLAELEPEPETSHYFDDED